MRNSLAAAPSHPTRVGPLARASRVRGGLEAGARGPCPGAPQRVCGHSGHRAARLRCVRSFSPRSCGPAEERFEFSQSRKKSCLGSPHQRLAAASEERAAQSARVINRGRGRRRSDPAGRKTIKKKGPRGIRRPRGGRLWEGARHALLRPALGAHALPVPRRRVPLGSHRPHGDGRPEPCGSPDLEGWLLSLRRSGPHVGSALPETPGRGPCENRHGHRPTGSAHAPAGDHSRSIPTGLANPHRLPFVRGRRWHPETAGNCGPSVRASHTPRCRPSLPFMGGSHAPSGALRHAAPGRVLRSCIGWLRSSNRGPRGSLRFIRGRNHPDYLTRLGAHSGGPLAARLQVRTTGRCDPAGGAGESCLPRRQDSLCWPAGRAGGAVSNQQETTIPRLPGIIPETTPTPAGVADRLCSFNEPPLL